MHSNQPTEPPRGGSPRSWALSPCFSRPPALSHAEEANPNNYTCSGLIKAGPPEVGSEEQQVQYTFYCNGPITGYQLAGADSGDGSRGRAARELNLAAGTPLTDTFSCSGEVPGYAVNCVGAAKEGYERDHR